MQQNLLLSSIFQNVDDEIICMKIYMKCPHEEAKPKCSACIFSSEYKVKFKSTTLMTHI